MMARLQVWVEHKRENQALCSLLRFLPDVDALLSRSDRLAARKQIYEPPITDVAMVVADRKTQSPCNTNCTTGFYNHFKYL